MPFPHLHRAARIACVLIIGLLPRAWAQGSDLSDGPYVFRQQDGTWLARSVAGEDAKVTDQRVTVGSLLVVPGVGAMPAFRVQLRAPEPIARDEVTLPEKTPIFVVADTHGEYGIFGELLQKNRIIDGALHWSFGKGHLVILGDVFDRGSNQLEILWLLYELQAQAQKSGGAVHMLIGNHEAMAMQGDLRYLNPKYVRTARVLGARSYAALVGADTVLGQWLRSRPAVLKIRNLLCLHGGISPELVGRGLSLPQINGTVRAVLDGDDVEGAEFVMGPLGPLWYRGYFAEVQGIVPATASDIVRILDFFRVKTVVVGHTQVPSVTPLYDHRVIAVQVYPHRDEVSGKAVIEALRVDGGRLQRATIDGRLEAL